MNKSTAMTIASDYRREGYDPSTALQLAWDEIRSGDELALVPVQSNRRNPSEPVRSAMPLALLAAGYIGWVLWRYKQTRRWNFQPWQNPLLAVLSGITEQKRLTAQQQKMAALEKPVNQFTRNGKDYSKESVAFISDFSQFPNLDKREDELPIQNIERRFTIQAPQRMGDEPEETPLTYGGRDLSKEQPQMILERPHGKLPPHPDAYKRGVYHGWPGSGDEPEVQFICDRW